MNKLHTAFGLLVTSAFVVGSTILYVGYDKMSRALELQAEEIKSLRATENTRTPSTTISIVMNDNRSNVTLISPMPKTKSKITSNNKITDEDIKELVKTQEDISSFIEYATSWGYCSNKEALDIYYATKKYCNGNKSKMSVIFGLMAQESNFKVRADSFLNKRTGKVNGRGLCQLSEYAVADYNKYNGTDKVTVNDLYDIDTNVKLAVWYLDLLRDGYGFTNMFDILQAYNQGARNYRTNGATNSYAKNVLRYADTVAYLM